MRPGPKFEITFEMAVENLKRVAERLGVQALSRRIYDEHGSFCVRSIERRHGWLKVLEAAGLATIRRGRKKEEPRRCPQECGRLSARGYHHCRTCVRRIRSNG